MGGRIGIEAREYKLMLDARAFAETPYEKAAKALWNRRLKPIIEKKLGANGERATRAEGELRLKKRRIVVFLDTKEHLLARRGIALRERTMFEDGALRGSPEVTLKFRTPDLLLAAEYFRAARNFEGDTVLEEDIAPMQVARGKKPAALPKPRSTYSRFSVSTKIDADDRFTRMGDVFERFGALAEFLGGDVAGEKLRTGPTMCEWVFQHACVDLGRKLDAEFGFTLWHFSKAGTEPFERPPSRLPEPDVAEISFDFKTKDGRMDADAAERAATLFRAMQEKLCVESIATSKTALGLPPRG